MPNSTKINKISIRDNSENRFFLNITIKEDVVCFKVMNSHAKGMVADHGFCVPLDCECIVYVNVNGALEQL